MGHQTALAEEIAPELVAMYRDEASQLLADYDEALLLLEAAPRDRALVDRLFRDVHTLKGNSAMFGLQVVASFAHELEELLAGVRAGRTAPSLELVEALFAAGDALRSLLGSALDRTGRDEALCSRALAMLRSFATGDVTPPEPEPPRREPEPAASAPSATEASVLRIKTEKVDELIDLVGELVLAHAALANVVHQQSLDRAQPLRDAMARVERRCRDLHESVLAIRMVPAKTAFGRFHRLVRDAAASVDKDVRLELVGEDTEMDRGILDRVAEALTHVLRNAVDHGVESRADRRAAGKADVGRVALSTHARSGFVFIEVSDDGRGLDTERIAAKARARGLVRADERLTDEQVMDLIFRPGFSTNDVVTELSGRGVGMDVVRKTIEGMKGTVTVTSVRGAGSTVRMKLPLTLALLDGLIVRAAEQGFVVPLASVVELLRPVAQQLREPAGGGEVFELRGELLQLVRLHALASGGIERVPAVPGMIVVVDDGVRRFALATDEVVGQAQVVVKSLEANGCSAPGVAGATVLGDGSIALLLDVSNVAAAAHAAATGQRAVPVGEAA
jgi:two-component system chemotaxis sensor kinase CheA